MVTFDYVLVTLFVLAAIWVALNKRYKFVVPKPRDRWKRVGYLADYMFASMFLAPIVSYLRDGKWGTFAVGFIASVSIWLLVRRWMIRWMYDWVSDKYGPKIDAKKLEA